MRNSKGESRSFQTTGFYTFRTASNPLASRKIDLRLLPILAAIYTFALVDRTTLEPLESLVSMQRSTSTSEAEFLSPVGLKPRCQFSV